MHVIPIAVGRTRGDFSSVIPCREYPYVEQSPSSLGESACGKNVALFSYMVMRHTAHLERLSSRYTTERVRVSASTARSPHVSLIRSCGSLYGTLPATLQWIGNRPSLRSGPAIYRSQPSSFRVRETVSATESNHNVNVFRCLLPVNNPIFERPILSLCFLVPYSPRGA